MNKLECLVGIDLGVGNLLGLHDGRPGPLATMP